MDMKQTGIVLFIGTVRRGEFESLQRRGLPLGVLVDTNSRHKLCDVTGFSVVESFDFSRPAADLVAKVMDIQKRHGLSCLYNVVEFYVSQTSFLCEALSLPGLSYAAAHLCLEKTVMRERFASRIGPDACARFEVVASESNLLAAAERLGYPVFLQPSNVSASMWSTTNNDPHSLLDNYRTMQAEVPGYYVKLGQVDKQLSVIVAAYLQGPNTSIDCLVDAKGKVYATPVVDVITGRDLGLDDFHHFARILPSRLPIAEQTTLRRLAEAGIQALDMTNCAAHVEFIGPRLGEIAGRPGANRARILELATGIDELFGYHEILCERTPHLSPGFAKSAAIVTPFPRKSGLLRSIRHLDRLAALPGYLYHEVRMAPGTEVGLARSGFRAPLYIEFQADDPDVVRNSVAQVASWSDLFELQ